jgi:hypothetical protein
MLPHIRAFLQQGLREPVEFEKSLQQLQQLLAASNT